MKGSFDKFLYYLVLSLTSTLLCLSTYTLGENLNKNKYEASKLILYQGLERHSISSKTCNLGLAFDKPEKFSCACVNGIWAFYGNSCGNGAPLAIVGGNNYCFQLPAIPIREVASISSPIIALSDSLAILEPSVKKKIYRNTQKTEMNVEDGTIFIAINSSWTLLSPSGAEGVCLDLHFDSESFEDEEEPAKKSAEGFFCTFTNISASISKIGEIKKGCKDSKNVLEPLFCQRILPSNPEVEGICISLEVLQTYQLQLDEDNDEEDTSNLDFLIYSKVSKGRKIRKKVIPDQMNLETIFEAEQDEEQMNIFNSKRTIKEPSPTPTDKDELTKNTNLMDDKFQDSDSNSSESDKESHEWWRSLSRGLISDDDTGNGKQRHDDISQINKMNKEWINSKTFPLPEQRSFPQDHTISYQLMRYLGKTFRTKLNLGNSKENVIIRSYNGFPLPKAISLLELAKDIMIKLCPLQVPEFFDMIFAVFVEIQLKYHRFFEPTFKILDFKRIQAALLACKEDAKPLVPSQANCGYFNGSSGSLPTLSLPEPLKSTGKEPIIESIWKVYVSTHSYCYKYFNQFYNDHHKFTTIMIPLFNNEIQKNWFRNITTEEEYFYSSVIGSVKSIWENLDKCTIAARALSTYPFHLTRPSLEVKSGQRFHFNYPQPNHQFQELTIPEVSTNPSPIDSEPDPTSTTTQGPTKKTRKQKPYKLKSRKPKTPKPTTTTTPATTTPPTTTPPTTTPPRTTPPTTTTTTPPAPPPKLKPKQVMSIRDRRKRSAANPSPNEITTAFWKKERSILNGKAFCLKKYNEAKLYLEQDCN